MYHLESGLSFRWLEINCVISREELYVIPMDRGMGHISSMPVVMQLFRVGCCGSMLLHCCSQKMSVGSSACVSVCWGCQKQAGCMAGSIRE